MGVLRRFKVWLKPARYLFNLARSQDLVLLEGEERGGGMPLRILTVETAGLKDFLIRRAFRDGVRERRLGKASAWFNGAQARARAPEADLFFWYARPALAGLKSKDVIARLPAWIPILVNLVAPECVSRGKEKFNRSGNALKKAGFTADYARERADFEDFYDRLFMPYVVSRHGENAVVQTREETLAGLQGGGWELLAIRREGVVVAGATVEFSGEKARFWQLGVRDGSPALLADGVSDAVYHHMLATCRARGVVELNLGSCRPFLQDGVLEYKRRFGAFVGTGAGEERGSFDLEVWTRSEGALEFLAGNALVGEAPGGGRLLHAFARGGDDEVLAQTERWRDRYCFMGGLELKVARLDS